MVVTKTMQHHQQGGDQVVLRKGPWMPEEDEVLLEYVRQYGPRDWSSIRSKGLLPRTGKSCRLRWVNKLKPDLKRSGCKFSPEEEKMVVKMQSKLGNKWAKIASYLPGRTDNDVKNFWSTRQKRLLRALQRPKLGSGAAPGSCEASAASSSDAIYETTAASELTAFQVPGATVPTNFETAFYFGEDEHHAGLEGGKMEPPELPCFENGDLSMVPRMEHIAAAGDHHFFPESGFYLPEQQRDDSDDGAIAAPACYQSFQRGSGGSSSTSKAGSRRSKVIKREQARYGVEENASEEESSHHDHRHHALRSSGGGVFGVNFLVEQSSIGEASSEFEFLLQQESQQQCLLIHHHDEFRLPGLSGHHGHWDKLPSLDYSAEVKGNAATAAATASIAISSSSSCSNSKTVEDSCSPDSVLATALPGDVFDCLEPLCPASSSEWWMTRTS